MHKWNEMDSFSCVKERNVEMKFFWSSYKTFIFSPQYTKDPKKESESKKNPS